MHLESSATLSWQNAGSLFAVPATTDTTYSLSLERCDVSLHFTQYYRAPQSRAISVCTTTPQLPAQGAQLSMWMPALCRAPQRNTAASHASCRVWYSVLVHCALWLTAGRDATLTHQTAVISILSNKTNIQSSNDTLDDLL